MKPSANPAPSRRPVTRKQVKLNLRRPAMPPEDEIGVEKKSHFWMWVGLVALFHLVAICILAWVYHASPTPPPETFMSLMPEGDNVKGTPGNQQAAKIGATTPAPSVHHTPPAPKPVPPQATVEPPPTSPPARAPIQPPPLVKPKAPPLALDKPAKPVKPVSPKPKVKVDLTLQDGPASETAKPVVKPKTHVKKAAPKPVTDTNDSPDKPESHPNDSGLSREAVAKALGKKLQNAGTENATKTGTYGAANGHPSPFSDFYNSLSQQIQSKWTPPQLTDTSAVNPIIKIHVEKDGRVPPESVTLAKSSGNQVYDDQAMSAARSLGYTLEPLPDGCDPDISITIDITH
jgi:TonB family protein